MSAARIADKNRMPKKKGQGSPRLRVSDDLMSWLRNTAAHKGVTIDDVVRENLEGLLAKSVEEITESFHASDAGSRISAEASRASKAAILYRVLRLN
jgi:predicted DNA-binding protein